jgi:esterase
MKRWPIPDGVRTVDIDGYPIAYTDRGNGTPVLLIHGSLNDYRSWTAQVDEFARHHRVLALSLRHYFPEAWDGKGEDFSLAQHALDVAEFIRALRLDKVHLVGHSRGGAVAYLVARDTPNLVRSLVLAEPRGLEDLLDQKEIAEDGARSNEALFQALQENLRKGEKEAAARAFVDGLNGAGAWAAMTPLQRMIILDNIATAIDNGELPGMRREDIAKFDFPVLLVRGEKSLVRYARGLEEMRRCNPIIGEIVEIAGAPHAMHRTHPEAFNASVLKFLSGLQ